MKKYISLFVFLSVSVFLFSCKEAIDLDVPGGTPKLVVEAEVTTETDSSYVKLTKTADYYSTSDYPVVAGATVTVNNTVFSYVGKGIYKPTSPFVGVTGQTYKLKIISEGTTYEAASILEPMFRIDSIFQEYKPASGFLEAGYSISYMGFDDRSKIKYTYFKVGYFDTLVKRDSFSRQKILFNNDQTPIGVEYSFELPFTRFQVGDECLMIFRSVDKFMNNFIQVYNTQTSGAPGPFQSPPANLPSNISGGAIGYFATYDVVRRRYTVK